MAKQQKLFSGIKPTGTPHLGNYLGALKQWVDLQTTYDALYSIVDYHAITIDIPPKELKTNTIQTAKILLALGINPKKSILFIQSHVPEHTELAWIFNCITPVAEMERMTQYKDKAHEHKTNINMGLFDYPALMAADILLYHGEVVPVGEDQMQHLELTRLIARKFNQRFGEYFHEPEAYITKAKRIMSLKHPEKKMSKDLGQASYIALTDDADTVQKKVMKAVTDSASGNKDMAPGVANMFNLLSYLGNSKAEKYFKGQYQNGNISYKELKETLAETIIQTLAPIQQRLAEISDHDVNIILKKGAKQAQKIAQKNLCDIKKMIGLL